MDPRLCCAAQICCQNPAEADAALVSLLGELLACSPAEAAVYAKALRASDIALMPGSMAREIAALTAGHHPKHA